MTVIPFVHEGLGNSSYLVATGDGRAALIDPDRNVSRYLRAAEERGWRIEAIFETHVHADFVTGALEAEHDTNARVFLPEAAGSRYPHHALQPGERVPLGPAEFEAVASPGHTPEHMSYLLRTAGGPPILFSGGSIIVGGAARTDLLAPELTDSLTRAQFHTLRDAFASLPDETLLYPTHGGGSFCSAGAGGERTSTLERERAQNPALAVDDEEEFVRWFPQTFPAAPDYFFRMRAFNQAGPRLRIEIPEPPALSPDSFERAAQQATVVDVRSKEEYARGHIPGSLSIAFRDVYPVWLGWLLPLASVLLFVLDGVPLERVVDESLLVGYESFAGWLEEGFAGWERAGRPVAASSLVSAEAARRTLLDGAVALDVREPSEVLGGRIRGALAVPLGVLQERARDLPKDRPIVVYCGHGERASTAASMLERAGIRDVMNLDGGFDAWREAGYPVAT